MFQGDRKAITLRLLDESGMNAYRALELKPDFSLTEHTDPLNDTHIQCKDSPQNNYKNIHVLILTKTFIYITLLSLNFILAYRQLCESCIIIFALCR